jgi:TPR repeat protein
MKQMMIRFSLSFIFFIMVGFSKQYVEIKKDFDNAINMLNKDSKSANIILEKIADRRYPPAIKALADSYISGDGVEKNIMKALFLYIKAADLNYGPAQFCAGALLQNGSLGFLNMSLAFYYFCLASINEDLEDIRKDASLYRDMIDKYLNFEQKRIVYKQVCNFFKRNKNL